MFQIAASRSRVMFTSLEVFIERSTVEIVYLCVGYDRLVVLTVYVVYVDRLRDYGGFVFFVIDK